MIVGYRDKATERFASGRHVKAFSGFARQAEMRLDRLVGDKPCRFGGTAW
jgi:toxin HigB-1